MSTPSIESTGFAAPTQDAPARLASIALIATVALAVSIAIVLTATMTAARAANLF